VGAFGEGFTGLRGGGAFLRLAGERNEMATSAWRGSLSFGLLTIPIRLYPAARSQHIQLHQLHSTCHTRLKQPLYCPTHKRIVERSEVVRGYEYEKGRYVVIEPDELKKITPASGRTAEILGFVKESQVDPIYFDSSYLALPEKESEKPYVLLVKALEDSQRLAIAKLTMHLREYTIFVRPRNHGLTVHTMYFRNEVREVQGYGEKDQQVKLKPQEIKLAEQLVESLSVDFRPERYHDSFQENLKTLIDAKLKGETIVEERPAKRAPVIDIMEALKRSLQQSEMRKEMKPPTRVAVSGKREKRRRLASLA
jgi:DNA end-binding protein Ku